MAYCAWHGRASTTSKIKARNRIGIPSRTWGRRRDEEGEHPSGVVAVLHSSDFLVNTHPLENSSGSGVHTANRIVIHHHRVPMAKLHGENHVTDLPGWIHPIHISRTLAVSVRVRQTCRVEVREQG